MQLSVDNGICHFKQCGAVNKQKNSADPRVYLYSPQRKSVATAVFKAYLRFVLFRLRGLHISKFWRHANRPIIIVGCKHLAGSPHIPTSALLQACLYKAQQTVCTYTLHRRRAVLPPFFPREGILSAVVVSRRAIGPSQKGQKMEWRRQFYSFSCFFRYSCELSAASYRQEAGSVIGPKSTLLRHYFFLSLVVDSSSRSQEGVLRLSHCVNLLNDTAFGT